jgi:tRNA(Ile2)-agmatinylcytidine synthase
MLLFRKARYRKNGSSRIFHIGLDDTDSTEGMCTTFLAFNLVKNLLKNKKKTFLIDYPNLIRLNPNIPWKTRGNGSLVLRIDSELENDELLKICLNFVHRFATSRKANSGLAIFEGEKIPDDVRSFSEKALFKVQSLSEAVSIMNLEHIQYFGMRSKQGLIGALAGIGNELKNDHTFELIAYRRNCSVKRNLEKSKVVEMDCKTRPLTFNSYDDENDRVLIMPHGKDPVFLGIRGETPSAVKRAFEMLLPLKNLLGYMIFRSNQGTSEHLRNEIDLSCPRAYSSGKLIGLVSDPPRAERGGHVFFELTNGKGKIPCAAYEPTGGFRKDVLELKQGDLIEVGGGIRKRTAKHQTVMNLEYFIPRKLAACYIEENPRCPQCFRKMSSSGYKQGFECRRCSFSTKLLSKTRIELRRQLTLNKLYLPDLKAHRHLTKPLQRYYYRELKEEDQSHTEYFIDNWIMTITR